MIRAKVKGNTLYLSFLLVFLISCTGGDQERGQVTHPNEEFLPSTNPFASITDKNPDFNQGEATTYIHRLQGARETIKIGIEKGGQEETFGEITGAVNDSSGNVLILESQYNEVRVFNKKGKYLFSFGKGGPGPGEFMSPEDIEIGRDGRIYIADRHNAIRSEERRVGKE